MRAWTHIFFPLMGCVQTAGWDTALVCPICRRTHRCIQALALTKQLPPHMPSRIHHPRLNRLIFSRLGWSTCFISVLPAPLEAPQLCSVLWVCRVIFPEHASNTWMHKRWWDLWWFTAARRNVQPALSTMSPQQVNRQLFPPPCNYSVANVQNTALNAASLSCKQTGKA